MLHSIQNDLGSHSDTIVDHGYTGQIDQEHIRDITGSILIGLITKRQVYLKEFMKGLEFYGLAELIKQNPESCKHLFLMGSVRSVDANYVFSLMKPNFSLDGSSRKEIEESVMISFQDFLSFSRITKRALDMLKQFLGTARIVMAEVRFLDQTEHQEKNLRQQTLQRQVC